MELFVAPAMLWTLLCTKLLVRLQLNQDGELATLQPEGAHLNVLVVEVAGKRCPSLTAVFLLLYWALPEVVGAFWTAKAARAARGHADAGGRGQKGAKKD